MPHGNQEGHPQVPLAIINMHMDTVHLQQVGTAAPALRDKQAAQRPAEWAVRLADPLTPTKRRSSTPPAARLTPAENGGLSTTVRSKKARLAWERLPGHSTVPDFVSLEEEAVLVAAVDQAEPPWQDSTFNGRHRLL